MAFGNLVGTVTTADDILIGAGRNRAFNAVFRYFQALPDIEGGFFQAIQSLDFLGGGSILSCDDPEGIATAHFVDDGFSRGFFLPVFA